MNEKNLVIQHNKIIEARYKLTVEEQRLIKALVSKIQVDDEDFRTYDIKVIELAKLLDICDEYYYARIKKITKKLRDSSLCFINDNGEEVQTGWLSSAKYYKGTVAIRFDPELKPYFLQLKRFFTSYELGNILHLKGMYSIRIYELLKQYERVGRREFTLEGFRQILNIGNEYSQFRDLKKWVLIPAEREIIEKTDIKYSLSEKKYGRKVIGLIFDIKKNDTNETKKSNKLETDSSIDGLGHSNKNEISLIEIMFNAGVSKRTAEQLTKDYDDARIKTAIAYTEAQQKEGKVKNPAGFLVEAIKNGYKDNQAEERDRKENEKKAREDRERREKALKESADEKRKQAIDGFLASLSEGQLAELQAEFLEANKNDLIVMRSFNRNGMESSMVKGCFRDFIFKNKLGG